MLEHRSSLVQQVVDAEFDTTLDDPSQGAIVVIYGVVNKERVVETVLVNFANDRRDAWWVVRALKCCPEFLKAQRLVLLRILQSERDAPGQRAGRRPYSGRIENCKTVHGPYEEECLLKRELEMFDILQRLLFCYRCAFSVVGHVVFVWRWKRLRGFLPYCLRFPRRPGGNSNSRSFASFLERRLCFRCSLGESFRAVALELLALRPPLFSYFFCRKPYVVGVKSQKL